MKTVNVTVLGEEKEIIVKGLKARELGVILNKFNELKERTMEDEKVASAMNGLIFLFKEEVDTAAMIHFLPQILAVFYEELLDLMMQLFNLTKEEVEDLEIDAMAELIITFLNQVDYKKIVGLLGKSPIQPKQNKAKKVAKKA